MWCLIQLLAFIVSLHFIRHIRCCRKNASMFNGNREQWETRRQWSPKSFTARSINAGPWITIVGVGGSCQWHLLLYSRTPAVWVSQWYIHNICTRSTPTIRTIRPHGPHTVTSHLQRPLILSHVKRPGPHGHNSYGRNHFHGNYWRLFMAGP